MGPGQKAPASAVSLVFVTSPAHQRQDNLPLCSLHSDQCPLRGNRGVERLESSWLAISTFQWELRFQLDDSLVVVLDLLLNIVLFRADVECFCLSAFPYLQRDRYITVAISNNNIFC